VASRIEFPYPFAGYDSLTFTNCFASVYLFAETFRHRVWEPLADPRLDGVCRQIDASYDNAHARNWQIIGLNECRDWSSRRYNELEWGYCPCVATCLEQLQQCDAEVLGAIEQAIAIVEGSGSH
jgi:hypothetical protein